MPESQLTAEAQLSINKPAQDVYDAIVNPDRMACYFISRSSGRMNAGQNLTWYWDDCGAEISVEPFDLTANEKIGFRWTAAGQQSEVVIRLEEESDESTLVKVCETGWPRSESGTQHCLQQAKGWMHMLCCLKAYLEFNVNLRLGKRL